MYSRCLQQLEYSKGFSDDISSKKIVVVKNLLQQALQSSIYNIYIERQDVINCVT